MTALSVAFWLVNAATSLLVGGLALGAGSYLHRALRLNHATFGYWLSLWLIAALLPLAVAIFIVSVPEQASAPLLSVMPLPAAIDISFDANALKSSEAFFPLPSFGMAMTLCYLTIATSLMLRRLLGSWRVFQVIRRAQPLPTPSWPCVASVEEGRRLMRASVDLRISDLSISPFAVSWPRRCIVIPAWMLRELDDVELRLILRHEAAHLSARDPQRAFWMSITQALLWFNPFLRRIADRVQLSAELRCDQRALEIDPSAGRVFAAIYLRTLRLSSSAQLPVAALSHRDTEGHAIRIRQMLGGHTGRPISGVLRLSLTGTALAAVILVSTLQMAFAAPLGQLPSRADQVVPRDPASGRKEARSEAQQAFLLQAPLERPRITGRYGDSGGVRSRAHRGLDFGAVVGTPIFAPAAGIVTAATTRYPGGSQYGTVIVLDHGNGWQTLYAHLNDFEVEVGQRVTAGQRVAHVGHSGRTTGPHLHLEVLHQGQRVDPEQLMR